MKRIFISRELKKGSIFRKVLENQGFEVFGESLIEFKSIDFEVPKKRDWVFFYSKNGVRFFLEKVGVNYFKKVKIAALGKGTAAFLQMKSLHPHFIGNGEPIETAQKFSNVATGSSVLFLRAKTSQKSVQNLLNDSIEIYDLAVYENTPKKRVLMDDFDFLVFTSSMNVEAYFKNRKILPTQQVVAIGHPTKITLKKLGIEKVLIAKSPSEVGLAKAVLSALA